MFHEADVILSAVYQQKQVTKVSRTSQKSVKGCHAGQSFCGPGIDSNNNSKAHERNTELVSCYSLAAVLCESQQGCVPR